MFRYISIQKQMLSACKKSEIQETKLMKTQADLDYLAMMCDVDLLEEDGEAEENE